MSLLLIIQTGHKGAERMLQIEVKPNSNCEHMQLKETASIPSLRHDNLRWHPVKAAAKLLQQTLE